ncbi:AAA family ATPase [Fibrella sp. HMF5335]|uniref:AAA family ATPase n=1 Tax=Fibrella rubiginis TaxID=2817060 RepID=A0A939GD36_9BACT|nr:AAA family ATPase [Fibrella rubiginis]MBO0936882.1 AAA family ATPase [Fibrella rubiginis]
MFNSIRLVNFFSFSDTTIMLESGVNILVGINGSGKSNLIKAIRLLKEGIGGTGLAKLILDEWGGFDNMVYCGNEEIINDKNKIVLSFRINNNVANHYGFHFTDETYYDIIIQKSASTNNYFIKEKLYQPKVNRSDFIFLNFTDGKGQINERVDPEDENSKAKMRLIRYEDYDPQELALNKVFDTDRYLAVSSIRRMLSDIAIYNHFDTTSASRIRRPVLPTSTPRLLGDGSNLAQVLNTFKIQDRKTDIAIRELLSQINSQFEDYNFNFIGGNIELMLQEQNLGKSIHVSHISDGTLRFMCLLAVLLNPKRGRLVCIDEPELGLHPDMVQHIAEAIQKASTQSQLFVATHSEHLLNRFDIEQIRVVEKDENNGTVVKQYSADDFAGWYENYQLVGKMWRAGDIGGNRY